MKKLAKTLPLLGAVVMLSACTSIQSLYYDRLQAADVSFPEQIRTVGVVNYVPRSEANGRLAAETLAQEIAATNYFNQVVICDSVLREKLGEVDADAPMPPTVADSLIHNLGVDMLFSMERIQIQLQESSIYLPEMMGEVEGIAGIVTPLIRTYIPGRPTPLFSVSKTDTIAWEKSERLVYNQLVKDASTHAATMPIDYLLPHWKEIQRFYFAGGNTEMRDASIYMYERDWEQAIQLLQSICEKKKGKAKMRAAYNLAVCYEVLEDFDLAKEYLDMAASMAPDGSWEQQLIQHYQIQLEEQSKENRQLRIQMKRFEP